MAGREPLTPLDLGLHVIKHRRRQPDSVLEYCDKLQRRSRRIYESAKAALPGRLLHENADSQSVMKTEFCTGARVLLRREENQPGLNPKWRLQYAGSYVVVGQTSDVNYAIELKSDGRRLLVRME